MTTATLPSVARQHVALYSAGLLDLHDKWKPKFKRQFSASGSGAGILLVTDLPVFRSGTFRDSMGFQHSWESLHIADMVRNFDYLRDRNIFTDVPVRDGHPGWLVSGMEGNGKVAGWHTSLRDEEREAPHDKVSYNYLLATFEVFDPTAMDSIESTLWRNVSSEVGTYLTNSEAEFWPVYQGVAYCDIPAVEGLKGFSQSTRSVSVFTEGESAVAGENNSTGGTASSAQPVTGTTQGAGGNASSPDTNPDANTTSSGEANNGATETPATSGQPTAATSGETAGEGQHRASTGQSFVFNIGGRQTTDFAAVQAHITALETSQSEQEAQARRDFVASLAEGNQPRIMASKITELENYALGLNSEQFTAWRSTWDAVPGSSLLSSHASGVSNPDGPNVPSEIETLQSELASCEAVVAHTKNAGLRPEKLAETPSFKRAAELREAIAALSSRQ